MDSAVPTGRQPPARGRHAQERTEPSETAGSQRPKRTRAISYVHYQPPTRLWMLELVVWGILLYLLFGTPGQGSAATISADGSSYVGLLKSCSANGQCSSWMGAGPGSGAQTRQTTSNASPRRRLNERQQQGGSIGDSITDAVTGSDSTTTTTSSSGSRNTSSNNTTTHLTIGQAAICFANTLFLALFFHFCRWLKYTPPPADLPDPEKQPDTTGMGTWKKLKMANRWYGFKRFGYRISRLLTWLNLFLLIGITAAAIANGLQTELGTGAHLLWIMCIMLVPTPLIEYLGPEHRLAKWFFFGESRTRRWRPGNKRDRPRNNGTGDQNV